MNTEAGPAPDENLEQSRPNSPENSNSDIDMADKKIPTLGVMLSGPADYPEWIISLKLFLRMTKVGTHRAWQIVDGTYLKPTDETEAQTWNDGNDFILITIRKNCEANVRSRIGTYELARNAYDELKKAYEGKTTAEFHALLDSITNISFDDRKSTIADHIANYEKTWNTFVGIISRADLTKDTGFGKGLKEFSQCGVAKAEFLLKSLPTFYSNTVENIRSKEGYEYDDVARKLKEYVPARQKGSRSRKEETENPVILKVEKIDNGKRCQYCIGRGWKGLNHTEEECYTKKREKAKKKAKKAKKVDTSDESDSEGVTIKAMRIGKNTTSRTGYYEYDTAASHHTTNELGCLEGISTGLKINVEGHNGARSTCSTMGTLILRHNNRTIRHEQCLYDPTYSNIISGLRMPDKHNLNVDGGRAELKIGRKILYKMEKDGQGM